MENETVRQIIQQAYRLQDYQYSGPLWLEDGRYKVEAKAETTDPNRLMLMLQNLLAERFKLVVHRQSKPVSGYALMVAKGGLKIKPGRWRGLKPQQQQDQPRGDSYRHGPAYKALGQRARPTSYR